MFRTVVKRVHLPDEARLFMISDLHGHGEGLLQLLDEVRFCRDDVLVIVGDLVEKGPQSLRTLRIVMQLCREYTVYPLMGNVDLWRLERLLSDDPDLQQQLLRYSVKAEKWWHSSFLGEMCREAGFALLPELDPKAVFPVLRERFKAELDFLASLSTILETQSVLFVHGGLPHEDLSALDGTDAYPLLKWDHFWQDGLSFHKYVAVGHWPAALYRTMACHEPIIDHERHILCLDGGCGLKDDGQLNLLEMPDPDVPEFQLHTWCPQPEIIAQEAQAESPASVYIHWGDHAVTVLSNDGTTARILHHARELTVPARLIYQQNGADCCDDYTDARPPVAAGERLHLVYETPDACYVKKGSRCGWYTGRYQKIPASDC